MLNTAYTHSSSGDTGDAGVINVHQGEFATSSDAACSLNTVLGSCVSVCLHDPTLKMGGMNHILLPDSASGGMDELIAGSHAMEVLINDLIRRGATKQTMEAKLFGGASMIAGLSTVGERNIEFARGFLIDEGFTLIAQDTGGRRGRRLRFWPATGRVQMRYMIADEPVPIEKPAPRPAVSGTDVELF